MLVVVLEWWNWILSNLDGLLWHLVGIKILMNVYNLFFDLRNNILWQRWLHLTISGSWDELSFGLVQSLNLFHLVTEISGQSANVALRLVAIVFIATSVAVPVTSLRHSWFLDLRTISVGNFCSLLLFNLQVQLE